ncbi:MAG: Crp/Fnr family transcriptional regulator, partial [Holophagales bacterium]|nr:Crp/Fnr family transcriptional regulator [Holophagales bacterium]
RQYRSGETIPLRVDELLRVVAGVVAHRVWHEDGAEGLVGLWGPGHLLAGHPDDACYLSIRAHTEAVVEVSRAASQDWRPAGDTLERLLERIRCLEAWSAMQSRQNMEQRLLGVLTLLAEQFGEERAEGTVIDVRVTHAQLAAAIGANRATVTRLLGPLRRRGRISTIAAENGERFCLPRWRGAAGNGEPPLARTRPL